MKAAACGIFKIESLNWDFGEEHAHVMDPS